ncbi:transglycosylase domain-containing protein [Pantoea ananatis]
MAERQVGAWFRGDFGYVSHSDWVGADEISPWMKLAVIASEDQHFPDHWGFDVAAIRSVLDDSDKPDAWSIHAVAQQTAKICFCGMAGVGCVKDWRRD